MKRENTPWRPVFPAALDWTERGDPRSLAFDDIYYSSNNGLEESRYVFLAGNQLPGRWLNWSGQYFCIAETGFGTGLNFLLTWQAWRATPEPRPRLHYLSIEKYPLTATDMTKALAAWPALATLTDQLLEQYPGLVPGQHRVLLDDGRVSLDLWWEDVADALPDLASSGHPAVDAWYLDGFAPARNEAMWQPPVLDAIAALSRTDATFSTFTAVGRVRRHLAAAGFSVDKVAGYGSKRECLRGHLAKARPAVGAKHPTETPWDLASALPAPPDRAIVVGAGLAGCTAAAALARRGIEVTLLEQNKLASAGSGNEQGILYTRLSRRHSPLTDFALQSYQFSTAFYRTLFQRGELTEGVDGALCGSFHQSDKALELAELAVLLASVPELAQVLEPAQAREVLGIEQPSTGYWYPRSGWLRPAAVCRALVAHSRIRLLEDCGPISLTPLERGWGVADRGERNWEAACVVIATGSESADMESLDWLPLQAIRGQTTQLPTEPRLAGLQAALCHEGYIAPAREGAHCIGATFNLQDENTSLRIEDHRDNLAKLANAVPAWSNLLQDLDPSTLDGRVAYRCASPDYLPLVGAVPDRPAFLRDFAPLRKNARQVLACRGQYLPGLYLSTGHGSRGLSSTPLAAELLASQICRETAPMSRELCRALAPARFIIRDLSRNRI